VNVSTQLTRQWGILRVLHDHTDGVSVKELADRFEVSKQTAARDVDDLMAAGFAVEQQADGKQKQLFKLADGVRHLTQIHADAMELLALYAARTQLTPLAGTPLYGDLMSLMHKIRGLVGDAKGADSATGVFLQHDRGIKSYRLKEEVIEDLVDAIMRRLVCVVEYRAAWSGVARTYQLRPLKLFFHHGGLYLYATVDGKRISTFAVERFVTLSKTRRTFKPPKVDLDAKLRESFGVMDGPLETVEVIFSPAVALYVKEREWHPDQKLTDLPDGSVKFAARMQGGEDILSWVLSWGRDAKLVRPTKWRERLARHARTLWFRYFADYGPGDDDAPREEVPVPRVPEPRRSASWDKLLAARRRLAQIPPEFREEMEQGLRWLARLADAGLVTPDELERFAKFADRPFDVIAHDVGEDWPKLSKVTHALRPWRPWDFLAIVVHQAAWERADYEAYCAAVAGVFGAPAS
jgi:predicted DNA-binding transcriptional regulator YafY